MNGTPDDYCWNIKNAVTTGWYRSAYDAPEYSQDGIHSALF